MGRAAHAVWPVKSLDSQVVQLMHRTRGLLVRQ